MHPAKNQVRIDGKEHTQDYLLGRGWSGAPFCKTCGVHVFGNVYGPPQDFIDNVPEDKRDIFMTMVRKNTSLQSLNVRTFDNIDLTKIVVKQDDVGTEGYALNDGSC